MTAWEVIYSGFQTLNEYILQHTLFCLVPAFFIAGAISAFLNQESVMRYFGPQARKPVAYGVASVSGAILAVCSCTVLPIFMGIYKKGAGLGPATAFLYSSPAINVLVMAYSIHLLGYDLGIGRIIAAVTLASVIGMIMALIFRKEEAERAEGAFAYEADPPRPTYQTLVYFGVMIAILVYGTTKMHTLAKYLGEAALVGLLVFLVWKWFKREEIKEWMRETWRMTKMLVPVLLLGVFIVGIIIKVLPPEWIARFVGGNSVESNAIASVSGALMYFATLTEVPIVKGLLELGMGKGPALTLLLAGPALSLPSMLVLIRILGFKKAMTYIGLVCVFATGVGLLFGAIF
jgi:uncharacterized protein